MEKQVVLCEQPDLLNEKLQEFSDAISLETFEFLLNLSDADLLYDCAMKYAYQAEIDPQDFEAMDALVSSLGKIIDQTQADMEKTKDTDTILYEHILEKHRNLVKIHYGLLGIMFHKFDPRKESHK